MNKKANKKAFLILLGIGLMYGSIACNLTDKISMKRTITKQESSVRRSMSIAPVGRPQPETSAASSQIKTSDAIEPSLFIAVPIVLSAIKEGFVEKEGLVLIKNETDSKGNFKKPLDILLDKDEHGLRNISGMIEKKELLRLLKKHNIEIPDNVDSSDIILGKKYTVEKAALIAFFNSSVTEEYNSLFPYVLEGLEVRKCSTGFEMAESHNRTKPNHETAEKEWVMPDLTNLPMRAALEKISYKTSKVKILGTGIVLSQDPAPNKRLRGDEECVLYGRPARP